MDKSKTEKQEQTKKDELFNSVTQKAKVENQNQTHNVKLEGFNPTNQKR